MESPKKSRPKYEDVKAEIRRYLDNGSYLDTRHAAQRKRERKIILPEILHVLRQGFHEKRKDEFKLEFDAWNYAIRGKTIDQRELRVCVSFDETGMLIITAIDLDASDSA